MLLEPLTKVPESKVPESKESKVPDTLLFRK